MSEPIKDCPMPDPKPMGVLHRLRVRTSDGMMVVLTPYATGEWLRRAREQWPNDTIEVQHD